MDTVALAKEEREKHGAWEVEVSYGGEADLHRHFKDCDKNPGHPTFIPVNKFDITHLPPECRYEVLENFVRATADLTVRISVKHVSDRRPRLYPGTATPYPCHNNRGRDMMRVGTGWVFLVDIYPSQRLRHDTCPCKECVNSPTPKTQFAHIIIRTAAHVVYDQLEGENTTVHLFFDRAISPTACSSAVSLTGTFSVDSTLVGDRSVMRFATHDLDLANKLFKMRARWNKILEEVSSQYAKPVCDKDGSGPRKRSLSDPLHRLTIIVSHPHGCSKQVSVGYYTNLEEMSTISKRYIYTTPTCPGSSGALVCVMSSIWWNPMVSAHSHSGNCLENRELNHSEGE